MRECPSRRFVAAIIERNLCRVERSGSIASYLFAGHQRNELRQVSVFRLAYLSVKVFFVVFFYLSAVPDAYRVERTEIFLFVFIRFVINAEYSR